jgi:hypothetical protein
VATPFLHLQHCGYCSEPQELTEDQRRLLTLFKAQRNRFVAVGLAIGLLLVLQRLYNGAAIASDLAPVLPGGRLQDCCWRRSVFSAVIYSCKCPRASLG